MLSIWLPLIDCSISFFSFSIFGVPIDEMGIRSVAPVLYICLTYAFGAKGRLLVYHL